MSTIEQAVSAPERHAQALGTPDRRKLGDLERFRERAQLHRRESDRAPEEITPPDVRPAA